MVKKSRDIFGRFEKILVCGKWTDGRTDRHLATHLHTHRTVKVQQLTHDDNQLIHHLKRIHIETASFFEVRQS